MKAKQYRRNVGYAVVGLGDIAQTAVLPAFANAKKHSELVALASDDPVKRKELLRYYPKVDTCDYADYDDYDAYLRSGRVDAVYICLPNSLPGDSAVRAARAGVHVLREKPMVTDEAGCQDIIKACAENRVKLMTAYRLHFERSNLQAMHFVHSGEIGEPRISQSLLTMQVKPGNIRLNKKLGRGTLYQFAPELIYFSDCILANRNPEPSGIEGLLDVHIIRSLYESAKKGLAVDIQPPTPRRRPDLRQEIQRPPPKRTPKAHAESPTR
jgi:predicted dehydrogenase